MRSRRLVAWTLATVVLAALLALGSVVAGVWWALRTERGSAWLLSRIPGITVAAPHGALLGDFDAQRVTWQRDGTTLAITGLAWRGLRIARGAAPAWLHVEFDALAITRLDVALAPSSGGAPMKPPPDLRLPVELELHALRIGEVHLAALGNEPLRAIRAALHIGASGGAEHRVEGLAFDWDKLHARADATLRTIAPLATTLTATLASDPASGVPAWTAHAALAGPLASPRLDATLTGSSGARGDPAGRQPARTPASSPPAPAAASSPPASAATPPSAAAPSLDLHATLHPFAAWPLGELNASVQALDLSALVTGAPSTALSGNAVATTSAANAPARLTLTLTNARAGRWNEGTLPVQQIAATLVGRLDLPNQLTLPELSLALGSRREPGGMLSGQASWSPQGWTLDAKLADLRPAALDARAPAMRLAGPLQLAGGADARTPVTIRTTLDGRIEDGPLTGAVTRTDGSTNIRGSRRASAAAGARSSERSSGLVLPRTVRLQLDASAAAQRIEVRELLALAGGAQARLAGRASQADAKAPWSVQADATMVDFDPTLWWPGRFDAAWRQQPTRLNARSHLDLRLTIPTPPFPPSAAPDDAMLQRLATLRGTAGLTLDPSTLLGVPLNGSATLEARAGAPLALGLDLLLAGNTAHASGQLATSGNGAGDAWALRIDGPALARLAPLYRLIEPSVEANAVQGTLHADAELHGRWPALASTGQLEANALHVGPLAVQRAEARWSLSAAPDAPLNAHLTLTQAAIADRTGAPGPSVDSAELTLAGTERAHTLEISADSRAQPPAWVDTVQAPTANSAAAHTRALLQLSGGLVDAPGAPLGGWHGTLTQLDVRGAPNAAPLLHAADVALDARWAGAPTHVAIAAGHAELLGAGLHWKPISWTAAASATTVPRPSGAAQIDAELEIDPLPIAPLLARAQPTFGWGGDLRAGAHLVLHSSGAPGFRADVVVERTGGDLTVTDEDGTRTLGLTDLRLGLAADQGVWNFTLGLAGKTVGEAGGAVVVRTTPQASWPAADAPIEGVLELRVADLGTWGNWVPPGWRLGGALHASMSIGGSFGAPQSTGKIDGSQLALRNFLEGVNIGDGELALTLHGATAHLDRFSAKAGSGRLSATGDAELGAAPRATLSLEADHFQLLGRVDRRIVTSGSGRLRLEAAALAFDGRFGIDEGLIDFSQSDAPSLASDVEVVRAAAPASAPNRATTTPRQPSSAADATGATAAPPAASNPPRAVALDLQVALGDKLRLRGRGLDTRLTGELHITSPNGRFSVDGTLSTADGTYAAYGQKLTIDRGQIVFGGALDNPRLDIEATRPNLDIRVGVAITGNAINPRVRLFSEPELSDVDKLSWLVMGRASDGLGRTDTALLQRAALALLSGEGDSPTDKITKAIGLDDIGLRQETDGDVTQTVVALGKQLSRRWYVGYERGLNATTGNFQLIYRIAQRFTLRAQSGDDSSLDFIWTWRWR